MKRTKLMLGDNIESLQKLPDNSIDSIVTDPPYGLSFMGKKWDYDVPSVQFWKEVWRVLKPGGHVLSFGGSRTYHRMVVNIEDAGFEIRDQIMWLYGSGFPKSHNIGLNIDKKNGEPNRGKAFVVAGQSGQKDKDTGGDLVNGGAVVGSYRAQNEWNGWGTALKPANEPICVARKPLSEKSVAENVLRWGTGGINVDGCRVGYTSEADKESAKPGSLNATGVNSMFGLKSGNEQNSEGRFPANIILECLCDEVIKGEKGEVIETTRNRMNEAGGGDDKKTFETSGIDNYNDKGDIHTNPMCPCYLMDEQSGVLKSGDGKSGKHKINRNGNTDGVCKMDMGKSNEAIHYGDKGGASRFFYQAKVSKQERNMGLDGFEETTTGGKGHGLDRRCSRNTSMLKPEDCKCEEPDWITPPKKNSHPTVKPVSLMGYLVRLVTPQGGIVLDPFMGSGSTGIAARLEGFKFCGMELDKDYFKIAEARIENYEQYKKFIK